MVLEFQWQARAAAVAQLKQAASGTYADTLTPTAAGDNKFKYTGKIDGQWASIEATVRVWEDPHNNYRCPLVLEMWDVTGKSPDCIIEELHKDGWDEPTRAEYWHQGYSVYAVDVVDNNDAQSRQIPGDNHIFTPSGSIYCREVVGRYARYGAQMRISEAYRGMIADDFHSTVEFLASCSPNFQAADPNGDKDPQFRVLRAVAEVESRAFFDSVQTYDSAFLSAGLVHWTLAREQKADKTGTKWVQPDKYGMLPSPLRAELAVDDPTNPYATLLEGFRVCVDTTDDRAGLLEEPKPTLDDFDVFRTWYWAYRFRSVVRKKAAPDAAIKAQVDALIARLGQLFAKKLPASDLWDADETYASLGVSEFAAALLFRMQVNLPSWPDSAVQDASPTFKNVYPKVRLPQWKQEHHDLFFRIILDRQPKKQAAGPTLHQVAQWPYNYSVPSSKFVGTKRLSRNLGSYPQP